MSKLLVVLGATGKQGGSVVNAILADPAASKNFKLRAISRDTSKPAAKALADRGVDVVVADLMDQASLVKAFDGAYAVFAVTDYWAKMDKAVEIEQGKNVADAAKTAGVKHFVWSSLINTTKATKGKLAKIEHFDSKAEVEEYVRKIGLPASFYLPGFYMSNLPGQAIRKDEKTGKYVFILPCRPDASIPLVDIEADTGKFVKAILLNRDATLGKHIYGASAYYSPQDVVDGFVKAFPEAGKGMIFQSQPDDQYKAILASFGMPEKAQDELLENMKLLNKEFGYYSGGDLSDSHSLLTDTLVSWDEFVKTAPAFKGLK